MGLIVSIIQVYEHAILVLVGIVELVMTMVHITTVSVKQDIMEITVNSKATMHVICIAV